MGLAWELNSTSFPFTLHISYVSRIPEEFEDCAIGIHVLALGFAAHFPSLEILLPVGLNLENSCYIYNSDSDIALDFESHLHVAIDWQFHWP